MTSPHFAWLPPEINSALIHAGPGAAPLLAAAEAWDGLAQNLASSASSFFSVTSDLVSGSWQGASATAMMSVASQYVGWLSAAATQAEAASAQASAIATAFESALVATVQPAMVGANRALVRVLASTNWFGLNAGAIMDTESAYEQMWAADVGAMFGYHADAATALAQLPPWHQVMQQLGLPFGAGAPASSGTTPITAGTAPATAGTAPATAGTTSATAGTTSGSSSAGSANAGSQTAGSGSSSSGNGGWGSGGWGNAGNNLFGLGGLNSGTGNIGLFNSGNNNIGFFNTGNNNIGIGNTGNLNTGLANTGTANVGLFGGTGTGVFQSNGLAVGAGADPLGSAHYLTGGLGAASLGTGLLNTAAASTGGLFPGVAGTSLFNPVSASAAAFSAPTHLGAVQASAASAASGPTPIPPALRTTTAAPAAFFAPAGSGDAGARTPTPARGPAIPGSGFFKDQSAEANPFSGEPGQAD